MDNRRFRNAMGRFATGVTVVTTEYKGKIHGMTVNSFMSISLDPKLIAVSIDEKADMLDILLETNKFGVSMLSIEQQELSMIFAKQKSKDQEIDFKVKDGNPILNNSLAALSCQVQKTVQAGDHTIFIAEVSDVEVNEGDPLLYFKSDYQSLN